MYSRSCMEEMYKLKCLELLSKQCGNILISKHCLERNSKYYHLYISSCSFLSEVSFIYSKKRSKNLAMLEKYMYIYVLALIECKTMEWYESK